ncbi:PREDICTED: probable leucine-rich repeat receptor-like protein kinase At5g49770 [Lupinus angustifolius]|uniref:probable leucine-rich repeat receptor-like protein kinase At5g49770 n=1 Tax=Lupinus angustifolius TaxID=3871 RepID=UPI00092F2872|nr:PREDICTED: probable leucine-rich repeat receptor-like protein kinase At5g49770 [Lupinus angustifolius]
MNFLSSHHKADYRPTMKEVTRGFDRNGLNGGMPSNFNNLEKLSKFYLSHKKFNGSLPDLTSLTYVDMSNNSFTSFDDIPSWVRSLESLTTVLRKGGFH